MSRMLWNDRGMVSPPTRHGQACPRVRKDKNGNEKGSPLIVMPGLDPGIPTCTGAARDARIKSGHDVNIKALASLLSTPQLYPNEHGARPRHPFQHGCRDGWPGQGRP